MVDVVIIIVVAEVVGVFRVESLLFQDVAALVLHADVGLGLLQHPLSRIRLKGAASGTGLLLGLSDLFHDPCMFQHFTPLHH